MFPALVNCCTIDWFTAWPEEALRSVATNFLDQVSLEAEVRSGRSFDISDCKLLPVVLDLVYSFIAGHIKSKLTLKDLLNTYDLLKPLLIISSSSP